MDYKKSGFSILDAAITATALVMFVYHLVATQYILFSVRLHKNAHLGLALILVFLSAAKMSKHKWGRLVLVLASLLGLVATLYMHVYDLELEDRVWYNTPLDLFIGVALILLVIEGTRRTFGIVITTMTVIIMFYPFLGQFLPEPFLCSALPIGKWISTLSVGNVGGIYSFLLSVSADWIFLFMVFGMLLPAVGADNFFIEIGNLVGRRFKGGPALMAVVSNGMLGCVQGGPTVAISGPFTIPLMRKGGYTAEESAAIAGASACGGGIMPPIMGVTAFAMAAFTGISYGKICIMAILPGILYYFFIGTYVQLVASKRNLVFPREELHLKELLISSPLFLIPITTIIVLLALEYSVSFVSFWSVVSLVLASLLQRERPKLRQYVSGIVEGAKVGAGIGVVLGAVGMISEMMVQSGIGIKLSAGIEVWSGGSVFVSILIIEVICVLFGMAGLVTPAYIMVAIFAAPALAKMGVDIAQTHFFIMYVTNFAFITPPVALGVMMACRISGADYTKSAIESVKVAAAAFILPISFIYIPSILLMSGKDETDVLGIVGFLIGLFCFQIGSVGYFIRARKWLERVLFFVVAVLLIVSILVGSQLLIWIGLASFVILWVKGKLSPKGIVAESKAA